MVTRNSPSESVATPLQTYLQDIDSTPLLSAEEERDLAERIAAGDSAALEHLIQANLRLVVNIARSYQGRGMALQDLIEEGNLGLMRAAKGFSAAYGTRFSTYASYWIKQGMRRAIIDQVKMVRLPAYLIDLLAKFRRKKGELLKSLGHMPTDTEVALQLGLKKRKLRTFLHSMKHADQSVIHDLSDDGALSESLPAADGNPAALVEKRELQRIAMEQLDTLLDEREAQIIRLRLGLAPEESELTLKDIGKRLGITRERVRQIETAALGKMRAALGE